MKFDNKFILNQTFHTMAYLFVQIKFRIYLRDIALEQSQAS